MRHTAYTILAEKRYEIHIMVNPAVITGTALPTVHARPARDLRLGITHIYDNVRAADLRHAKLEVMSCFSTACYYKVKQQNEPSPKKSSRLSASPVPFKNMVSG
ncbi:MULTISPECIES: hypothetical protein [Prevotellaceae]|uniref:hypothetical protein n=1 Tax=Prevotellaceae TaxID=171552 RepID=UPI00373FD60E